MSRNTPAYPPIEDYAFISDCNCSALISRSGSIDWCCMPRMDEDSCFGRLLDSKLGGYCSVSAVGNTKVSRQYLDGTMVLETRFETTAGAVRICDFFDMGNSGENGRACNLVRVIEGITGRVELRLEICPRFDYGEIVPLARAHPCSIFTAIGSNKGLAILPDMPLEVVDNRDMKAEFSVSAGERLRLVIHFEPPEKMEDAWLDSWRRTVEEDGGLARTRAWWSAWQERLGACDGIDEQTKRSAILLKALTFERTGAIAAAPTTSLPEWIGAGRNWDYRFSWVRDSVFAVRALHELGYHAESDAFLRFVQRSSAGSAAELQIMYGVDGKRRLTEVEIEWLEGYCGSKPVRIGNLAAKQVQLDVYGEVMELAWEWHSRSRNIDQPYWDFLKDVLDTVCRLWEQPDHGIWERRGEPLHHVHSKAMCWGALDRGMKLAAERNLDGPLEKWREARDAVRSAIERQGYDAERGIFVQSFGSSGLDAALLLLGRIGFVAYDDPRMMRTAEAIRKELDRNGLILRYDTPDGIDAPEGAFIPCTFWMAACLASQGRKEEAEAYYRRAVGCANDIGLFSEEYDVHAGRMLGNFPQALTHVSQITAKLVLGR